jgi:hypothetical protein
MGGGFGGGGAGRNGGIGSRTGLTTGNRMYGGMAMGRPGGPAMNPGAWGVQPQPAIGQGPLSGAPRRPGVPTPVSVPGVNPVPENVLAVEDYPMPPSIPNPFNAAAYRAYAANIGNFRSAVKDKYGFWNGNVTPGPGPSSPPAPGMTQENVYNLNAPPSYRGAGPSPYDPTVPGPGAPSNQLTTRQLEDQYTRELESNIFRGGSYNPGSRGRGPSGW